MLSRDHGGGLLDRSWGPGDGRPVEEMKVAVDQCLQEYLYSGDVDEAARCIHELNAKLFYHEVVKRAVVHALDKSAEQQQQMSNLLQYLMERDQLSASQAVKGFQRLNGMIGELVLDSPTASAVVSNFISRAVEDGVLPSDFKV
jgi:programmed cell death protein 4